jgi:hypothetical protein
MRQFLKEFCSGGEWRERPEVAQRDLVSCFPACKMWKMQGWELGVVKGPEAKPARVLLSGANQGP